jgi:hypothetical protein
MEFNGRYSNTLGSTVHDRNIRSHHSARERICDRLDCHGYDESSV